MSVEVLYSRKSTKQLKNIGQRDQKKIKKKVSVLKNNPLAGKPLKGEFEGLWCMRAWPLRMIYKYFPKKKKIIVVAVEYRGNAY